MTHASIADAEQAGYTVSRDAREGAHARYTTTIFYGDRLITEASRPESPEKADEQALLNLNDQLGGTVDWLDKEADDAR